MFNLYIFFLQGCSIRYSLTWKQNIYYITRNLFTKTFTFTILADDISFYWIIHNSLAPPFSVHDDHHNLSPALLNSLHFPHIAFPAHEIKITAVHISNKITLVLKVTFFVLIVGRFKNLFFFQEQTLSWFVLRSFFSHEFIRLFTNEFWMSYVKWPWKTWFTAVATASVNLIYRWRYGLVNLIYRCRYGSVNLIYRCRSSGHGKPDSPLSL